MRSKIHPDRYLEQMSIAQNRVEAIMRRPSRGRNVSLQREFDGMSERELLQNRAVLNKLEGIMMDWKRDGRLTYDAEFVVAELAGQRVAATPLRAESFGQSVTYVNFGPSAGLRLTTDPSCHVDGLYYHPTYRDGQIGLDLAFVCDGPNWEDFGDVTYGKAIATASRIGILFLPFSVSDFTSTDIRWIDGDDALLTDEVWVKAQAAAEVALAMIASIPNRQVNHGVNHPVFRPSRH